MVLSPKLVDQVQDGNRLPERRSTKHKNGSGGGIQQMSNKRMKKLAKGRQRRITEEHVTTVTLMQRNGRDLPAAEHKLLYCTIDELVAEYQKNTRGNERKAIRALLKDLDDGGMLSKTLLRIRRELDRNNILASAA